MRPQLLLALLSAGALLCGANLEEIYKYGDDPESAQAHTGTPWTYDAAGDDWQGMDERGQPWVCLTGQQQSPINIPATQGTSATAVAAEQRSTWQLGALLSNGSNVAIINNGHTVHVSWTDPAFAPTVSIVLQEGRHLTSNLELQRGNRVTTVQAEARQLHFHTSSEHLIAGALFPLEAHLVSVIPRAALPSCPADGCTVVTAALLELSPDDANNTWLQPLFNAMPDREGQVAFLPAEAQLDLQQLLVPSNTSYAAYAGSFTTPPCTEGVLWFVFLAKQQVSVQQWRHFMRAVGDYNCTAVNGSSLNSSSLVGSSLGAAGQPPVTSPSAAADATGNAAPAAADAGGGTNSSSSSSNLTAAGAGNSTRRALLAAPTAVRADIGAAQRLSAGLHAGHMQRQQQSSDQVQHWWFQRSYHLSAAASPSSSSSRGASSHGRQLLGPDGDTAAAAGALAAGQQQYVCSKLGLGQNSRLPQPLRGRVVRLWRDPGGGKKSLLPEDAATAAGAGAIAGIVLGTTLGAALTAVVGVAAYKAYQKRRLRRLYRLGVSSTDMMLVQQEVESAWLREGQQGGGGSGGGGGAVGIGGSSSMAAARLSPRNQAVL